MDIKKSIIVKVLCAIVLVAVLIAAAGAMNATQSYVQCASRIVSSAPPTDSRPPAAFPRLARVFWQHRDLYVARVLARECKNEGGKGMRRFGSELFALGVVKARLSLPDRETLSSILLPVFGGGRGLTRAAHVEWGRPPASLSESEMTWLFVVGQMPSCSKRKANSEPDRQTCERLYQSLLAQTPRLHSSAP